MKKFIFLTLALAMAVCAATFGTASAGAAFTDSDSIQYKEAVDVIAALKIMDGYEDGSFGPTRNLTRGAAAKIICNMLLGPSIADGLPKDVRPFPDVAANSTFAGYIAYVSDPSRSIVSGYPEGNFRPSAGLTGNAFLKMLLGALGYDQNIEGYVGNNWSVNVISRVRQIELDKGLIGDLPGSGPVTRETAALFVFNTLQADTVEYDSTSSAGRSNVHSVTSSNANVRNVGDDNVLQFAEDHFPNLHRNPDSFSSDAFGRPANKWTLGSDNEIGIYADSPVKVYYGDVTSGTLYTDLGLSSTRAASLIVNGGAAQSFSISRNGSARLSGADSSIGDGTEIQVFRNEDTNAITISAVVYYSGKVDSIHRATSTAERYITIAPATHGLTDGQAPAPTSDASYDFVTDSFAEGDIVAYTYSASEREVQSAVKLTSTEGSLTRYTAGRNLVMSGRTYSYAKMVAFQGALEKEDDLNGGNNYTLYLLSLNGTDLVMWVEGAAAAVDNHALVMVISNKTDFENARARLLFTNGTEGTVTLDKDYRASGMEANTIVSYTVKSNGDYTLETERNAVNTMETTFRVNNRIPSGLGTYNGRTLATDNNTIFIIKRNDEYSTYTGIRNVPNITVNGANVFAYHQSGTAKVVFVTDGTVEANSRALTFIAANSASGLVRDGGNRYRVFNAVVDGQPTEVRVKVVTGGDPTSLTGGNGNTLTVSDSGSYTHPEQSVILNSTTYDADNNIIRGEYNSTVTVHRARGIGSIRGDEVKVGTFSGNSSLTTETDTMETTLYLSANVNVYYVDDEGVISVYNLSSVQADDDDWVFYTNDNGDVTNLFVLESEFNASRER